MKHTIKTPQGSLSLEAIGQKGNPAVLVTVHKAPFPPFPITIKPEDAAVVYQSLGMVLEELSGCTAFPKTDCPCPTRPCVHQCMLQDQVRKS